MQGSNAWGVLFRVLVALIALSISRGAAADEPPPQASGEAEPSGPPLPWKAGPTALDLPHEVKVDLPDGYQFLGMPEAGQVLERMGNLHNEGLLGLVVSLDPDSEYFVILRYEDEGYIKDDEELDAKDLLETIQEGEEEYNTERQKLGFTPIHAAGWLEDPRYEKASHHLVWALIVTDPQGESINYNTRILGRHGYLSLNLVTDRANLTTNKPAAATLLRATTFKNGARYEDFNESTDKVAEYGLAGLVLGGAGLGLLKVAKVGLLAKFGKVLIGLLIAGKKAIAALVIGGLALAKRLLTKKQVDAA
jgi:uncharacterized membrane-anchored protein